MNKHKSTAGPAGLSRIRSLVAFRHQNPIARLVSAITAFAIAALLVGINLSPAQAVTPCTLSGGFEIDGNMNAGTCSGDDWGAHQLTPTGDVDHTTQGGTYSASSKDSNDPTTWSSAGSTPSKADFERVYATSNTAMVSGTLHYFVYVAWERTSSTGTQGYAVEIDNSPTRVGSDGSPQPDRSLGGTVYFLSAKGSSAPGFDRACKFDSQADYTAHCTASPAGVTAETNSGDITDPFTTLTQGAGTFYEIGLDITALTGKAPGCPGPTAASVYLRSLTGNIDNSDNLKGYMEPLSVRPDSTCVAPTLTTQTQTNAQIDGLDVVAPGTPQHDVATVTGTQAHPAPTGTVTFSLCGPTSSAADCTTGGASGGTKTLVQHASNSTAQSNDLSPTTPGWYCWRAHFTPDPVNDTNPFLPATATVKTNECFKVAYANPTIGTISSAVTDTGAASHSVGFTTLGDVATLSDVVSGADLSTQHVTFKLYGPLASTPGANDCTVGKLIPAAQADVLLDNVDATTWSATAPTYKPTTANGPGYYTWVASYAGDAINHSFTAACGAPNETQLLVGPVLTLTKGTPHSVITAGDPVVYDLNVKNLGDGTAKNVVVTDTLPVLKSGNTWSLNATSGYNCQIAGAGTIADPQVVTCEIGNLNPLPTLTQIAEVTATTTPADCGDINNSAELTADPDVDQTVGPRTVTVQCPGLSITKTADHADPVNVGSDIGFKVNVTNTGAGTATGVLVKDVLPTGPGITWSIDTTVTPPTGTLDCVITDGVDADAGHQVLSCTGSLDAGTSAFVHVTSPTQWTADGETQVNSCLGGTEGSGVYDNTAQVSASNVTGTPNASAHEAVLCPDLHVTKVADDPSVDAGSPIGFLITASNTGDAPATGAFVNDPLPTGVTWSIPEGGSSGTLECQISAGVLTCSGTLAAGASQTVQITAPTTFADCGVYNNTATFTATDSPQTPNDSDSTSVLCSNLALTKTADASSVNAGGQIGFVITASNHSGETVGTAHGVRINDPLPAGSGIDWSIASGPDNCSITGAVGSETLVCSAVDLAPGASESVHVVSATTNTSCQAYPNTATLAADNARVPAPATATTTVANCVVVSPPQPQVIVSPPKQHHPAVLPNTGGPDAGLLAAGMILLLGGGGLVAGDRRRRRRS